MRTSAALLLFLAAGLGCPGSSSREALGDALAEYSHGVRWGRSEWIKPHLSAENTGAYDPSRHGAELQVVTCEVESVNLLADKERAEVNLRVEWYLSRQHRVHTSLLRQIWRWTSKRWELREQRLAQGAPFPPPVTY